MPAAPCDLIGTDHERLESIAPTPLELRHGGLVERRERVAERLAVGPGLDLAAGRPDDLERGGREAGRKLDGVAEPGRLRTRRPEERAAANDERVVRPLDPCVERGRDSLERAARDRLGSVTVNGILRESAKLELSERAAAELRKLDEGDRVPFA